MYTYIRVFRFPLLLSDTTVVPPFVSKAPRDLDWLAAPPPVIVDRLARRVKLLAILAPPRKQKGKGPGLYPNSRDNAPRVKFAR